ncbi:MAG: hypothetical protein K9L22_12845 [Methylococcaceae bacterium]|nr:hypothetical protein [Methylococcaceae bacterium]
MKIKNIMVLLGVLFCLLSAQSFARNISPLPSNLDDITQLRGQNGVSYYFYITGSSEGAIWGSGTYTDDSDVAVAAVHSGLLAPGEKGVIKVVIKSGQNDYQGSLLNGITSNNYGAWSGSYSVMADDGGDNPVLPDPGNLNAFRAVPGGVYQFNVTGNTDGGLWGSNVYTDDSVLAKAAVHAGVLANGQTGVVRVVIVPEQENYMSSQYNAIASSAYAYWVGSYAVSDVQGSEHLIPYPGSLSLPFENISTLSDYRGREGGAFYFRITGENVGGVWGTQVYTDDSRLATAAVHSGVLALNQTGVVKATILAGQGNYTGSVAHGITSSSYGTWSGSYSLATPADGDNGAIPDINSDLVAYGQINQSFTYQISATDNPSAFNATGLPEGLSVSASGLISGAPKVNGHFKINLLASNAIGVDMVELSLNIGDTQPVASVSECIFNWAERDYAVYFNPPSQPILKFMDYTYRFYPGTGAYLATHTDGNVYVIIPILGNQIINVGTIEFFKGIAGC